MHCLACRPSSPRRNIITVRFRNAAKLFFSGKKTAQWACPVSWCRASWSPQSSLTPYCRELDLSPSKPPATGLMFLFSGLVTVGRNKANPEPPPSVAFTPSHPPLATNRTLHSSQGAIRAPCLLELRLAGTNQRRLIKHVPAGY